MCLFIFWLDNWVSIVSFGAFNVANNRTRHRPFQFMDNLTEVAATYVHIISINFTQIKFKYSFSLLIHNLSAQSPNKTGHAWKSSMYTYLSNTTTRQISKPNATSLQKWTSRNDVIVWVMTYNSSFASIPGWRNCGCKDKLLLMTSEKEDHYGYSGTRIRCIKQNCKSYGYVYYIYRLTNRKPNSQSGYKSTNFFVQLPRHPLSHIN